MLLRRRPSLAEQPGNEVLYHQKYGPLAVVAEVPPLMLTKSTPDEALDWFWSYLEQGELSAWEDELVAACRAYDRSRQDRRRVWQTMGTLFLSGLTILPHPEAWLLPTTGMSISLAFLIFFLERWENDYRDWRKIQRRLEKSIAGSGLTIAPLSLEEFAQRVVIHAPQQWRHKVKSKKR